MLQVFTFTLSRNLLQIKIKFLHGPNMHRQIINLSKAGCFCLCFIFKNNRFLSLIRIYQTSNYIALQSKKQQCLPIMLLIKNYKFMHCRFYSSVSAISIHLFKVINTSLFFLLESQFQFTMLLLMLQSKIMLT